MQITHPIYKVLSVQKKKGKNEGRKKKNTHWKKHTFKKGMQLSNRQKS